VTSYINFNGEFLQWFLWFFPSINSIVQQVTIPLQRKPDKLIWIHSSKGDLSLKDAYLHKAPSGQNIHWEKSIWSPDIPPSKSLTVWKLMHNKLPTDDNLSLRGCDFPSMCSCCFSTVETSAHLFFECLFALRLWNWLSFVPKINL